VEHLDRCVYGGIYDEGSPLADEHGFRKDVIEAVRTLQPPVLRWPGGNFTSGYHWVDGVGPKERRPRRTDLAWHVEESNQFGTDEFMAFCSKVGAEPYICLNMGTGSMDEAQAWLEYCNGTGNTEWANRRRDNGHDGPYGVRYWGLGNEMYGPWQIGQLSADDYVKRAKQWAKALRWTDPAIELVSCGETGWTDWDETVIPGLAEVVSWHSLHLYTGNDDYWTNAVTPYAVERSLRIAGALIEKARYNQRLDHEIHVAFDEWNVWFPGRHAAEGHGGSYSLGDALAVTTYLHAFLRHADVVKMANLAQLVNVLAPIVTNESGLFLQTIYHPLRLFADHLGTSALDVYVESDQHEYVDPPSQDVTAHRVGDLGPFPVLDAVATISSTHKLMLSVVNRSPDSDIAAQLCFRGGFNPTDLHIEELNGADWSTANSFDRPDSVSVHERETRTLTREMSYRFPPHSLTVMTADLGQVPLLKEP
jgi:alpha-N-arabinofuranosidase